VSALSGLKLAYVAFDPFPNLKGSGTRISELSSALAAAGAEVTLITLPPTTSISLPPRVKLLPIRVAETNYLSRAVAFRDAVGRALVAERPDIVQFRGPFEGQAALAFGRRFAARTIFEVNGLPSVELAYHHPSVRGSPDFVQRLARTESRLLRECDAILTQSFATERFLRLRGAPAEKTRVIPNGAHLGRAPALAVPEPTRASGGRCRVLYAGTLAPWQGLPELLVALGRASRGADIELPVVGWGQKRWRRDLARRVRRLALGDRVELLRSVPRDELARLVAAADVCAAPLRRDRRNRVQGCSPIKLFEYMAAGRAVLATRLPCLEEIVTDGVTGVLARPGSSHDLADQLLRLASDPRLRASLGRAAQAEIVDHASWQHRGRELVRFYEDILVARASA